MAEIFEHNKAIDIADLPDHPIPAVNGLDLLTVKKVGGADLIVVIAEPIDGSEFSQNRLLTKLKNYFGFINSSAYQLQASVKPTPSNTKVIVKIHPKSSDAYIDLLSRCEPWAIENNCSLEMQVLTDKELG
jgi:hypothetical protein